MASERNRILELTTFIESQGIVVNIGKNRAFGNKGCFKAVNNSFRIDISKGHDNESILKLLAHEFAHYVHYKYDKNLRNLDFIFPTSAEITEELISITVSTIPKNSVTPLFEQKNKLKKEIKNLVQNIKTKYPEFKESYKILPLEKSIKKTNLKYLLNHDSVKVFRGFYFDHYSINDLQNNSIEEIYIKFKSKKRALNRLSSRISKLNRYYNSTTELFARSFELYATDPVKLKKIAPRISQQYELMYHNNKIPELVNFINLIK